MTKHNQNNEYLLKICKKIDEGLLNENSRNEFWQNTVDEILTNYESKLGSNSTPLSKILHGLKKTDATLIKMYVETVTNAHIGLNDKNKLVIKLPKDTLLTLNENFGHITWYELAKDTKTIKKDHYDNLEQAIKAYRKWFEKAIMTCQKDEDIDKLYTMMDDARSDIFENITTELTEKK